MKSLRKLSQEVGKTENYFASLKNHSKDKFDFLLKLGKGNVAEGYKKCNKNVNKWQKIIYDAFMNGETFIKDEIVSRMGYTNRLDLAVVLLKDKETVTEEYYNRLKNIRNYILKTDFKRVTCMKCRYSNIVNIDDYREYGLLKCNKDNEDVASDYCCYRWKPVNED